MHYHCEVYLPPKDGGYDSSKIEELVEFVLAPFEEEKSPDGFWDWYQIGGRWKGAHVPGYDPDNDTQHRETCSLCHGTGTGCNGCQGKGTRLAWPTEWPAHPQDIAPLHEVPDSLSCATLVVPDVGVFHEERYSHEVAEEEHRRVEREPGYQIDWRRVFAKTDFGRAGALAKPWLRQMGITDGFLVTVDYHS